MEKTGVEAGTFDSKQISKHHFVVSISRSIILITLLWIAGPGYRACTKAQKRPQL